MNKDILKYRVWSEVQQKYITDRDFFLSPEGQLFVYENGEIKPLDMTLYQVEKCSGLKDKNGTLIFKEDIVRLTRSRNSGWTLRGTELVVEWNTFNCCGFGFGSVGNLSEKCSKHCVVVGNIHENREVLK